MSGHLLWCFGNITPLSLCTADNSSSLSLKEGLRTDLHAPLVQQEGPGCFSIYVGSGNHV
jgi:hypothetical protein